MKPIYKPKTRAGEYSELALNIYTGCNHGCVYCYARKNHERWKKTPFEDVSVRDGLLEALEKQLSTGAYKGKLIHLCFTCDPYPADIDTTPTREVVKLIKGAGAHVQILTKGGTRAERDFDLLDENDWFGVTIACNDQQRINQKLEVKTAKIFDRLNTLALAKEKHINTWISCEPVYSIGAVYGLITRFECIGRYKIGKLNYYPSDIDWGEFGRECERLCKKYNRNYYIKDDLRKCMEDTTHD